MRYKVSKVNALARQREESRAMTLAECLTELYAFAESIGRSVVVRDLVPKGTGHVRFYDVHFTWADGNPGLATILPCA